MLKIEGTLSLQGPDNQHKEQVDKPKLDQTHVGKVLLTLGSLLSVIGPSLQLYFTSERQI